ncbi:MAG: thioredoxin [Tenericutes bacterium]|nr:thioredoxin [Mycoplasmatota bacterium]
MIHLNDENFNDLIKEGKVLVDFYAEWCGPCKMMGPVLEEVSNNIKVVKVDIDKFGNLANEYRIMSVPTLVFFKDGVQTLEVVGFHTKEELNEIIDNI